MECGKLNEPYKATKLWKEMVETFRVGIPLRRHRRHMKVYDNCFTGQEAVHWFQSVLQKKLYVGSNITKDQTVQLLSKFLKAGVFQNMNASSDVYQQCLKEGDLYQLTDNNSPRPPLAVKSTCVRNIRKPSGSEKREGAYYNMDLVDKTMECPKRFLSERDPNKWFDNGERKYEEGGQKKECYSTLNLKYRHHLEVCKTHTLLKTSEILGPKFNCNEFSSPKPADKCRQYPNLSGPEKVIDKMKIQDLYISQVSHMWKQVLISRLVKLVPELEMSCKLELEDVPGEWILANATAKLDYQYDFYFPQSLVVALNSLVHWPLVVPNEILKEFKDHYLKLKEPLTTFKLHSLLCKVFLYITSFRVNDNELLTMKLPPNLCFETAFTSDSPVTRIVPQRSVDTLHFSCHGKLTRSVLPSRPGKHNIKMNSHRAGRRVRIELENDKMHHVRNRSGGYVNPALSRSIEEDLTNLSEYPQTDMEQELDYVAALESLETLMRCSRRYTSTAESDSQSSESSSYYTAASSSSSAASSRRNSLDAVDSSIEEKMVSVMQLLLLCIPTYYRTQLSYLLCFMSQWNLHQTDVIEIFTPAILRSNVRSNTEVNLVRFLVTHHELVMTLPFDLEAQVSQQISDCTTAQGNAVTFCKQVSNQQFEEQRLKGSQLALSELLEQILEDRKMNTKEKRKRLKMFKDSYPHIYLQRFPDPEGPNKVVKKESSSLLHLVTLNRLKSLRL